MVYRSPFFYVGDKYKLMPQLSSYMPDNIETFYDPFTGGGSAFLNATAKKYCVNDIDRNVIKLHETLAGYSGDFDKLLNNLLATINDYGLTCSFVGKTVSAELKKEYPKTYFAKYNKVAYVKLRDKYNEEQDALNLYLLLIYGFNHMIRFNSAGKFNLPVGNVDFNENVVKALGNYLSFMEDNDVRFTTSSYANFLLEREYKTGDFVYLDPPYFITSSEYNKMWSEKDEIELYGVVDELAARGVRFGLSNMLLHKGRENTILENWSKKYKSVPIKSNYISFNDNTIKEASKEVYITNYECA